MTNAEAGENRYVTVSLAKQADTWRVAYQYIRNYLY